MPTIPEALAVALAHHRAGRFPEAEEIYRQILAFQPQQPQAWHLLGVIAHQTDRPQQAIEYLGRAIGLQGDDASFHSNLGVVYEEQGQIEQAAACYRRALELAPDLPQAHNNLGVALHKQNRYAQAAASYRRALELEPDYADAHYNLGNALAKLDQLSAAIAAFRRALELHPAHHDARCNLGNALKDQGMLDASLECYRASLAQRPDLFEAHSNLLFSSLYHPHATPQTLAAAHAEYDRRHAAGLCAAAARRVPRGDPPRRLRVGFVSADLGEHPVGFFLVRCLEHLDPARCETVCYSGRRIPGGRAERLRRAATAWREVDRLSDARLAESIAEDRIDILFDLAGHSAGNRLLTFARKPAPVQITWLGSEGTTGLSAIDYVLADRYLIAAGEEAFYREQVLRMPEGYVCYDPPAEAPPVGPLPAGGPEGMTFGSFSNLAKINRAVVQVWAEILRRLPQSRLVLKNRRLADAGVQHLYRAQFAACGVEPARLMLLPESSYADYLATYRAIDVMLDPFPFSGSATTCDALWMGVPVITWPGATFVSRHSYSHLSNLGLAETIVRSAEEYVERAVSLAGDLPRLAALRADLRPRMAASPLCDGKRFAGHFLALLEDVWQRN